MEEETKLETPEEKARRKERERFMRQAITQAKKAEKLMEVPIGCVIVYEGKVIARGYNRRNTDKNTLSHAELNAIRKASKKARRLAAGGVYVVCHPGTVPDVRRCDRTGESQRSHHRQHEPEGGCAGSVLNLLQMAQFNHQVEIERGVLEEECSTMLSGFFRELRDKKKSLRENTQNA